MTWKRSVFIGFCVYLWINFVGFLLFVQLGLGYSFPEVANMFADVLDLHAVLGNRYSPFLLGMFFWTAVFASIIKVISRMNYPVFFFSKKEKGQILAAIREAEKNTSGEIRLHLEYKVRDHVFGHAKKVFHKIGMTKTEHRNGVLIFLATRDKKFAVLGDVGINEKVPSSLFIIFTLYKVNIKSLINRN